jgi:hypothetical protein
MQPGTPALYFIREVEFGWPDAIHNSWEFARDKFPVPFVEMLDVRAGWGYGPNSDQPDIESADYGTMMSRPTR